MSLHFSANQYEGVYRPWRLGAWEVPRHFPGRPRIRKGRTKIIADDRGHLLRGGAKSQCSPWGPLTQPIDLRANSTLERKKGETELEKFVDKDVSNDVDKKIIERIGKLTDDSKGSPNKLPKNSLKEDEIAVLVERLRITGSSVLGSPRVNCSAGEESKCSSGTLTPATFRLNHAKKKVSKTLKEGSLIPCQGEKDVIIKEASKLPVDTIEDALLPRRHSDDLLETDNSRAFAVRMVQHPGATNCTKFTVIRPYTAPTQAATPETPLLPKRPKTSKTIRKIPEIEFALKWDLNDNFIAEENEILKEISSGKKRLSREPQTPRSVTSNSSDDSGIHIPKQAWKEGPDKNELALKLEALRKDSENNNRGKEKAVGEAESGYGTPVSAGTKGSLRSKLSNIASGMGIPKSAINPTSVASKHSVSESRTMSLKNQERISIDSKCLSAKLNCTKEKLSSKSSSRHSKEKLSAELEKSCSPKPPVRDPLEIMETIDSVFHKVPIRDTTGFKFDRPPQREEKHKEYKTLGIQTEGKKEDNGQLYIMHNHALKDCGNQGRARNCVACEVKANGNLPKKYVSPSAGKTPFRFGRPEHRTLNKARYVKQSEKYRTPLRSHNEIQRIWPINTLSSPFNNREGYGQDQYPTHMRLRTTYEMAHQKINKPQRTSLIKNLYK